MQWKSHILFWRIGIDSGVGKLFTPRATFEKILKPRAALIGRAKKRSTLSRMSFFSLQISEKKGQHVLRRPIFH